MGWVQIPPPAKRYQLEDNTLSSVLFFCLNTLTGTFVPELFFNPQQGTTSSPILVMWKHPPLGFKLDIPDNILAMPGLAKVIFPRFKPCDPPPNKADRAPTTSSASFNTLASDL